MSERWEPYENRNSVNLHLFVRHFRVGEQKLTWNSELNSGKDSLGIIMTPGEQNFLSSGVVDNIILLGCHQGPQL